MQSKFIVLSWKYQVNKLVEKVGVDRGGILLKLILNTAYKNGRTQMAQDCSSVTRIQLK